MSGTAHQLPRRAAHQRRDYRVLVHLDFPQRAGVATAFTLGALDSACRGQSGQKLTQDGRVNSTCHRASDCDRRLA